MHSKDRSAATGGGFGAAVRGALRILALLLVLLVVGSMGLVIGKGTPEAELSPAERALGEGAETALTLAETAAALEESAPSGDGAGYAALAEMLRMHSVALLPAGSAAESPSPTGSESQTPSPVRSAPPSPGAFLAELTASYMRSFEAAAALEAAPARVLASAATAQWLGSRALAESLGTSIPEIPVPEIRYDDGAAPDCPTEITLEADVGLDGARTAVLAEQRAAYAYEVVAARTAEPGQLLERMEQHEDAAAAGSAILAQHCVAGPLPAAAYALEEAFLSDPDSALRDLEESLAGTYADLVGVSTPGPVREWAIWQLVETARHSVESGGNGPIGVEPEAFPGIDPSQYPKLSGPGS